MEYADQSVVREKGHPWKTRVCHISHVRCDLTCLTCNFLYKVGDLVVEGLLSMGLTRLVNEQTEGSPGSCHSGSGLKAFWKLWVFFLPIAVSRQPCHRYG